MLSAICMVGAIICAGLWNARRSLPYNEAGRYFDPVTATVFHEQSVAVFGAIAIALAALAIASVIAIRRF
ncbi:hypothetical protein [uncultured Erythrobacter sp.]|uniref:hypothetical protein n=1 Tax=uncultured Erythrobacter sp. TaxID=263913 RepID=UPI00262FF14C|nr:hypothetical protein [uncultured Erythrobacter sp.]